MTIACTLALAGGCKERERQDREYKSDPVELLVALGGADGRAQVLEVLDLIAAADEAHPEEHEELVAQLHQLLRADDPMIAAKAGDVLARWGDTAAAPSLVVMIRHPNPWVRLSAATSLAILEDPSVVDAVAEATTDDDENVRAQACRTLGEIGVPITGTAHARVVARLSDEHPSVRAAAAAALGRVGSSADLPALRAALRDPHSGVSVAAAVSLGRLRDRQSVPDLIALLDSDEQARVVAAEEALGRIDDPAAIEPLLSALDHPDTIVRGEALRALIRIGDSRVIPYAFDLALDEDPLIQTYVPYVVGLLYEPEYLPLILGLLRSPDPEVRSAAAFSLGVAQERRGLDPNRELLDDPHHTVRMSAASALGLLGDAAWAARIRRMAEEDPNPQVRDSARVAAEVAMLSGNNLFDRLVAGLRHPESEVRLSSATVLTALDDKRAIPALRTVLDDEEELIRNAARGGIKRLGED